MEIKVYNNVFENEYKTFEYDTSKPLLEQLEEHIEKDTYRETLVECYDPQTGETFYAPMVDEEIETPSVMIVVDGKTVDKDYQVKEGELVSVVFLPANERGGEIARGAIIGAAIGVGVAGLILASVMTGPFAAIALSIAPHTFALLGITGAVIGGFVGNEIYENKQSKKITSDGGKQGNQSPDVRGAENSSIKGENFSFVVGKHLVSPRIIGDPITEYSGAKGEDAYIRTLYQVGYAPLKLTDFKLSEFFLAYNRDHKIGDGTTVECGTLTSGMLKGYSRGNVAESGDIVDYWKNNDIELEIIQQPNTTGEAITIDDEYQKNTVIDLANRPQVPASTMRAAGWDVEEGEVCTVYSVGYSNEAGNKTVLVTPINPDGTVLTPSQLDVIADDCLSPTNQLNVTISFNVSDSPVEGEDRYLVNSLKVSLDGIMSESVELQMNNGTEWISELTVPAGDIYADLSESTRWAGNTCRIKIGSWTSDSFVAINSGTETVVTPQTNKAPEHPENLLATFTGDNSIAKSNEYAEGLHENQEAFYAHEHYSDGVNYGRLYTSTYDDQQVNANLFYIADKKLDDTAKVTYKGAEFPNKFRTNGVFFTAACPMEFTVTLDFQSGLYDTYTKTVGNNSTTHYDSIPLYLCVQWRVYNSNNKPSDSTGKDYNDWHTIDIGTMKTLDATAAAADKAKHQGNDFGNATLETIYGGFYGKRVSDFSSYSGEDGISEIRVSKKVTLTKAQCKEILADTNKGRVVEVRVLRVSPNYMNMVSDDGLQEGESAHSYSDHVKVSSILTKVFDEEKLRKEDTLVDVKPLSDEDYKKFCLVAIKAKADASGYINQQLKSLSCIAESFSPIWDSVEHKVLPENITNVTRYFGYYKNGQRVNRSSDDDVEEVELTGPTAKAQYEQARQDGFNWYAQDCGSNYASIMKNIIFTSCYTHNGGPAYKLTSVAAKYNNNTAASGFLLGCFGPQNGPMGLGSDDVNLAAIGEWAEKTLALKDGSTFDMDTVYNGVQYHKGDEIPVRMEANAYIYSGIKLEDLLQKIAFCGRAAWYVDENGKISVVMDAPADYTKGVINAQNCISSSNAFSYENPPAGLFISFSDENDGYQTNQFYCWSDGNSPSSYHGQVEPYSIEYVTNPYQIWSLGRYLLALREMNREVLTRKIGLEGTTYNIGDVVLLQSEDLLIGDCSGRVQEVIEDDEKIYGFVCNSPYEYNAEQGEGTGCSTQGVTVIQPRYYGKSNAATLAISMPRTQTVIDSYTQIIPVGSENPSTEGWYVKNGTQYVLTTDTTVVSGHTYYVANEKSYTLAKGTTNVVLFPLGGVPKGDNDPSPTQTVKYNMKTGDICMFGLRDLISAPYRITKIKPEKDGTFTQTLIPYDEGLYSAGAEIPSFQSFMTPPVVEEAPVSINEVPTTIAEQNTTFQSIYNAIGVKTNPTPPAVPSNVSVVASRDFISIAWYNTDSNIKNTVIELSKDSGAEGTWSTVAVIDSDNWRYNFNRNSDGYPEADTGTNKLSTWRFRLKNISLCDVSSSYTTAQTVNTDNYGTWQPANPSFVSKIPLQGGVDFTWDSPATSVSDKQLYGNNRFELTVKYNGTSRQVISTSATKASYEFIRSRDGYPEKVHDTDIPGLDLYTFDLKVSNESGKYAEITNVSFVSGETDYYGTWIPYVDATYIMTKNAERDGINIRWKSADNFYGVAKYTVDIKYNGTTRASVNTDALQMFYVFDRSTDGYPELHDNAETGDTDLSLYTVTLTAVNSLTELSNRSSTTTAVQITANGYKTWKIPTMSVQSEVLDRTAILTAIYTGDNIYGTPQLMARIKRRGNLDDINGQTFNQYLGITEDTIYFEPEFEESPQPSSISDTEENYHKVYPKVTTMPQSPNEGDIVLYDGTTGTYVQGTYYQYNGSDWVVYVFPFFKSHSNKITHTLPLLGQTPRLFDANDDYIGHFSFEATDVPLIEESVTEPQTPIANELLHYTGTTTSDLENGKWYLYDGTEEEWVEVVADTLIHCTTSIVITGFEENKYYVYSTTWTELISKTVFVPTIYKYELKLTNESGNESNIVEREITALCTSISDLVHSHEHYKELYVEKLSAISANIGMITQGGMGSFADQLNYWALSDMLAEDVGVAGGVKKGAFRVGGSQEFFQVTPLGNDEYKIELKAGNIELTSTTGGGNGMDFLKGTFVYSTDKLHRLALTPEGILVQTYNGSTPSNPSPNDYITTSQVTVNANNDMIISNSDVLPEFGHQVESTGAKVYHLDGNATDEDGTDPMSIAVSGDYIDNTTGALLNTNDHKCLDGTILKTDMSNYTGQIAFVTTSEDIVIGNTAINIDGTSQTLPDPLTGYSDAMRETSTISGYTGTVGSYLGLNETQVQNGIFF